MIKKLIKKLICIDGENIDVSRRRLIKGVGSLAALTVVASAIPSVVKALELKEQLKLGVIENQTFYVYEPIVIDLPNTIIRNCYFIVMDYVDYVVKIGPNATGCHISDSYFEAGNKAACLILIESQKGDMTTSMQSAIDFASSTHLPKGNYKTSSPITLTSAARIQGY